MAEDHHGQEPGLEALPACWARCLSHQEIKRESSISPSSSLQISPSKTWARWTSVKQNSSAPVQPWCKTVLVRVQVQGETNSGHTKVSPVYFWPPTLVTVLALNILMPKFPIWPRKEADSEWEQHLPVINVNNPQNIQPANTFQAAWPRWMRQDPGGAGGSDTGGERRWESRHSPSVSGEGWGQEQLLLPPQEKYACLNLYQANYKA